jgi:hypothetical protein
MPRTTTLSRDKSSGSWRARKQIPPTIRTAYAATFGRSHEEKFSKPATLSEREARVAFADWLANVEARIAIVSAQLKDDGVDLTHAQAHALAGRWYRWKAALHSDDPGSPQRWADEIRGLTAGIRDLVPEADGGRLRGGPSEGHASTASFERFEDLLDKLKTSQAQVLNKVAEASRAAEFLAQERVFLSAAGRRRFLCALVYELVAVNALLARRSLGDYSPDPRPARFPAWKPPAPNSGDVMSPMGLYKAWCTANEARTSNSTRARWITVFRNSSRGGRRWSNSPGGMCKASPAASRSRGASGADGRQDCRRCEDNQHRTPGLSPVRAAGREPIASVPDQGYEPGCMAPCCRSHRAALPAPHGD